METWGKSSFTLYIKERIKIIKRLQLRYSQLNNACLEVYGACRHILRFHRFIRNWWSLYRLKSWFFKFSKKRSARNQCPLGHYGKISRYVLNTYVEKHTVTYAYFHVQTNKICTIVSTEVPPYPRTSTGTICTLRVVQFFFLRDELSRGIVLRNFPWDNFPGGKIPSNEKIHSNAQIVDGKFAAAKFSHHHPYTIRNHLTVSPLHHWRKWKVDNTE